MSNHVRRDLNLRKAAHIDQIVNALWLSVHPMTEDEHHTALLPLLVADSRARCWWLETRACGSCRRLFTMRHIGLRVRRGELQKKTVM